MQGAASSRTVNIRTECREFVHRSPALSAANYVRAQLLHRLGLRRHESGATAAHIGVAETAAYAQRVVSDYIQYGACGRIADIEGKHILEIGPGDNLGVGLMLLALGAATVTCLDGFSPRVDSRRNGLIYGALFNAMTEEQQRRVSDSIIHASDGTISLTGSRLTAHYGAPIERPHTVLSRERYDVIVSRAVLEHLSDIAGGWQVMLRCLKPGGAMWHKVDFRSHEMFHRIHPLYFLTISEQLWGLLSRPDPTLNRARLPVYRELVADHFQTSKFYFTHILDEAQDFEPHTEILTPETHFRRSDLDQVGEIRPFLQEPFKSYTDEQLLISGIFLTASGKV